MGKGGARVRGRRCGEDTTKEAIAAGTQDRVTTTKSRIRETNAVTVIAVRNAALKGHKLLPSGCSSIAPCGWLVLSDADGIAMPGMSIIMPLSICIATGDNLSIAFGNIGPCPEQITKPKLPTGASASSMTTLESKARDINTANTTKNKHRAVKVPRDKKWRSSFMARILQNFTVLAWNYFCEA